MSGLAALPVSGTSLSRPSAACTSRPFRRCASCNRHGHSWRPARQLSASRTESEVQKQADQQTIENLNTSYCDDFECTSSPAVEQTVRSLARDLERKKYTQSLFQPDVQYNDGFRSFRGFEKYLRPFWVPQNVTDARVTILSMKMLDNGAAQLDWRLEGKLGMLPLDIKHTSTFSMNLLTGRVTSHRESWDLSKTSPPAAVAATVSRMVWSAAQTGKDAGEGISTAVDSLTSFSSMDEDSSTLYQNPNDPMKFFSNQDNGINNDVLGGAFLVALLYLTYTVWSELEKLN